MLLLGLSAWTASAIEVQLVCAFFVFLESRHTYKPTYMSIHGHGHSSFSADNAIVIGPNGRQQTKVPGCALTPFKPNILKIYI